MPTKKKRHTCYKCHRVLVADRLKVLVKNIPGKSNGKYQCINKKVCKAYQ